MKMNIDNGSMFLDSLEYVSLNCIIKDSYRNNIPFDWNDWEII